MEKFAIISDPVKSDRIINALIKAGGKNTGHLTGEGSVYHMYYYIDSKGCINYEEHPKGYQITTIEEFEEKLFDVKNINSSKVAIKGDGTLKTGKRIIEALEKAGGINHSYYDGGNSSDYCYYISDEKNTILTRLVNHINLPVLTIDQYESQQKKVEPLDLTKILEGCEGVELYCTLVGKNVKLHSTSNNRVYPICVKGKGYIEVTSDGRFLTTEPNGECVLFPSFDNRDWSTFKKPKKQIKFGTPVMTSNNGNYWKLKKYSDSVSQKYIVPVTEFDFNNFESNKY